MYHEANIGVCNIVIQGQFAQMDQTKNVSMQLVKYIS